MATVALREITRDTVRDVIALVVDPSQTNLVASNSVSIAQAHFEPDAWFRAIYADELPVGFVMVLDNPANEGFTYVWRFMIDQRYQRLGYGRQAMQLIIERAQSNPRVDSIVLSHADRAGNAGPFYRDLGFVETGEIDDGEVVMRLDLQTYETSSSTSPSK